MKLPIFNIWLVILLFGGIGSLCATDRTEFSKKIVREFGTTNDGTVSLYNKYGKVDVRTWSENRVKIDVTILVFAKDQSEADRTFARINVNFMNTSGYVKAETMIGSGSSSWSWSNMWGDGNTENDYQINYEVYLPPNNQIDLRNMYGDSYLASFNGKLTADIKYGNIKSADMSNDVNLNLAYGDGYFNSLGNINADVSYGKMKVQYAKSARVESKYSNVNLFNVNDLRLDSKYDEIQVDAAKVATIDTKYSQLKLGDIGQLNLTAQYTDAKVTSIIDGLNADMQYGDITIGNLHERFQSVRFTGSYADMKVSPNTSQQAYSFELHERNGDIVYPRAANISTHDQNGESVKVLGKMNGGGGGKIYARVDYGSVKIGN
jgi:hypothetical protein